MVHQILADSRGQRNEDWGIDRSHTPFTDDILDATFPRRFNMPQMNRYAGRSDPVQHLMRYSWSMTAAAASDAVKCKAFPIFLAEPLLHRQRGDVALISLVAAAHGEQRLFGIVEGPTAPHLRTDSDDSRPSGRRRTP